MIADLKQNIDLVPVVQAAGVELKQRGTRHVGLCPFHSEKTPSFYVFDDNHYKCFGGCGEHGDVIDFVQKLYDLSFPEALRHLGIERGELTPQMKARIRERKQKAELVRRFDQWCGRYAAHLGSLINRTLRLMPGIEPDNLHWYASLLDMLPQWEYYSDILLNGSDEIKFQLYKEAQQWTKKILI
jgi:CHC2-type zinc finger protein